MSRSRHSSTEYFGSPSECSPNSRTRLPVKSLIGEIDSKASCNPSVTNQWKDAFWSSIRSGMSSTCGIFAKLMRARLGPGSSYASTVNAPVASAGWDANWVVLLDDAGSAGERLLRLAFPVGLLVDLERV